MPPSALNPTWKKTFEGFYALERGGYLTASLEDARRVCAAQGGFLFRMNHLYLVGDYQEAIEWGWSPYRTDGRLTARV